MAYRNGTYVAFHAEGTSDPTKSDFKYYAMLKAWAEHKEIDFSIIDSHEKTAVRDSSTRETLKKRLRERLRNSKHLLLIIGKTTKNDKDWVPEEISYAVDECEIPIIAAYTNYDYIVKPSVHENEWPPALKERIDNGTARVIHIPFKKEPIKDAIGQFDMNKKPQGALTYYTHETYKKWGLIP
jgi:Thoeris protein ThsB, TIR-like domain